MHEDELRALIRDAIARHLGRRPRRPPSASGALADCRSPSPACLEITPVARPLRVPGPDRTRRPVRGRTRRCAVTTAGSASRTATERPFTLNAMSTTSRPRVFVSRRLFQETLDLIAQHADMDVFDRSGSPSPEELLARTKGCAGLVAQGTDKVDAAFLDQLPDLRVVCNVAVGYNNIDVAAARAAQGRRHQHAGRAQRGLCRADVGPDPRRHASARRGRAHPSRRAVEGIPARFPARHGPRRQDARRHRHGAHRPGRRGQGGGVRHAHGVHEVAAAAGRTRSLGPDGVPYEGLSFEEVMKQSDVITLHVPLSSGDAPPRQPRTASG